MSDMLVETGGWGAQPYLASLHTYAQQRPHTKKKPAFPGVGSRNLPMAAGGRVRYWFMFCGCGVRGEPRESVGQVMSDAAAHERTAVYSSKKIRSEARDL